MEIPLPAASLFQPSVCARGQMESSFCVGRELGRANVWCCLHCSHSHPVLAPFIDRHLDKLAKAVAFPASLLSTLLGCRDPRTLNSSKQAPTDFTSLQGEGGGGEPGADTEKLARPIPVTHILRWNRRDHKTFEDRTGPGSGLKLEAHWRN